MLCAPIANISTQLSSYAARPEPLQGSNCSPSSSLRIQDFYPRSSILISCMLVGFAVVLSRPLSSLLVSSLHQFLEGRWAIVLLTHLFFSSFFCLSLVFLYIHAYILLYYSEVVWSLQPRTSRVTLGRSFFPPRHLHSNPSTFASALPLLLQMQIFDPPPLTPRREAA